MTLHEAIGVKVDIDVKTGKKLSHSEIYGRAIEFLGWLDEVAQFVPFPMETLCKKIKSDPCLNNTAMNRWDAASGFVCEGAKCRFIGGGIWTLYRMISAQYGKEFTNSHYGNIHKVYSIWVCLHSPQKRKNTITKYLIKEENLIGNVKEERKNYDLLTVIMICLGKPEDDNYIGILKLLEVLLSSERDPSEKKKILQEDFSIQMTKQLEDEVSVMCNLSEGLEQRGIAKGFAQGMVQGIAQGKEEGTLWHMISVHGKEIFFTAYWWMN